MKHEFGGLWTRAKLRILERYLRFYTTALKNQKFRLHYVDAFAGTGVQNPKVMAAQEMLIPSEDFDGSVRTALSVKKGFHRYHFNDLNVDHVVALEAIKSEHPSLDICIYNEDANVFVRRFADSLSSLDRAVVFLDPFSTELDWETLAYLARSQKIDLWLLFPISVLLRMTPKRKEKLRPEWRATINRLLGTADWESSLYQKAAITVSDDLFGDVDNEPSEERLNVDQLQNWVGGRLKELFPYVAEPVVLRNSNSPLFSLYFAVSNPNRKAWGLASRAMSYINKTM